MSSEIPDNCVSISLNLLSAIENGTEPTPIFFARSDCNSSYRWPPVAQSLQPKDINVKINPRNRTDLCNNVGNRQQCPVPILQRILLPPHFKIIFYGGDKDDMSQELADPGEYTLNIENTSKNWWTVNQKESSTDLWKSQQVGGTCKTYNEKSDDDDDDKKNEPNYKQRGYDKENKLIYSLASCGAPFWPSFSNASHEMTGHGHGWKLAGDRESVSLSDGESIQSGTSVAKKISPSFLIKSIGHHSDKIKSCSKTNG